MGIFDRLFGSKKTAAAEDAVHELPVLGREETTSPRSHTEPPRLKSEPLDEDAQEELLNQELPSVNRRRKGNSFASNLGYIVVAIGGLMMMYLVTASDKKESAVKAAPKPVKLANNLPPLAMPAPPKPIDIQPSPQPNGPIVPAINSAEPIPLATANQTSMTSAKGDWTDRKMDGGMMITGGVRTPLKVAPDQGDNASNEKDDSHETALGQRLKPTVAKPAKAQLLPDRNFIIAKGASLDCALETAIDSTAPGITTCRLTSDVYSDNGHVVLLDRGSQLVGEYQGGMSAGQVRIFVVWSRVKTPNGVIVALNSPGTDALGRSGHEGWVDTHFMERFGAALMVSFIKDAIAYARAEQSKNGAVVIQGGDSNTDKMSTEILKNTINIPPTLYVNHGDHIKITVARDLDFSTVYGLGLKEE